MGYFLTYAYNQNGEYVHVDTVPNGAQCNCTCRRCGGLLVAKNAGHERQHHFAHASGHECEGAYESSLHLLAKDVLEETGQIMLPQAPDKTFPSGLVRIDNIKVEEYDRKLDIQPDVEGTLPNGERVLIEFYVTSKVRGKKRETILANHIKCLEVDIQFQVDKKKDLQHFLLNSSDCRHWILPEEKKGRTESFSVQRPRDPKYEMVRDAIKKTFDEKTLCIYPHSKDVFRKTISYDLKASGYDVCEVDKEFNGFKCDLLLYRSKKEKLHPICINIRGRSRSGYSKPKDLKVIDIVLTSGLWDVNYNKMFTDGQLKDRINASVNYEGFQISNEIKKASTQQKEPLPKPEYTYEQVLQICKEAWRKKFR